MSPSDLNDCYLHDKDRLLHADAVRLLVERTPCHGRGDTVQVVDANGRVAAETVRASAPVPGHRNAAVDGYAFAFDAYSREGGSPFTVSGRVAAGHPLSAAVGPTSCVRIFTGAPVPDGLDTVVMQEDVRVTDSDDVRTVFVPGGLKRCANVRAAGEDLEVDAPVATIGQRLRPQVLAALTSAGVDTIRCAALPRVGMFSSGDEVIRAGQPLAHGQVYDANAAMLPALVTAAGGTCVDLGILPDNRQAVRAALQDAAQDFDLVITSGGASLGEEDHIVSVLDEIGTRHLWQIAVKPGRPMMFGQVGNAVFMGLPGNPVAVFVCFLLYGRPLLARLAGATWAEPQRFKIPAGFDIARKKADRREFLRGWIEMTPAGPVARKYPKDGSGLISSLRAASGFVELAEDVTAVGDGDLVDFLPFNALGID